MSDTVKVMNSVKEALLSTTKIQINRIFTGEYNIAFKLENENIQFNYSLTKNQLFILLRMSLFHLLQFVENGTLTDENNQNCRIIIISLLHIINNDLSNEIEFLKECINSIFTNPLILRYFLPIYRKKKNPIEEMFMETFYKICETLKDFNQDFRNILTIHLYKEKFINLLKLNVEKCKNREKTKEILRGEFLRILPFNDKEIVELIGIIMELPKEKFVSLDKFSIWGNTIANLITCLVENEISFGTINVDILKKLFTTLSELKKMKIDTITWDESLFKYLQRFPHNIGDIDKSLYLKLYYLNFFFL